MVDTGTSAGIPGGIFAAPEEGAEYVTFYVDVPTSRAPWPGPRSWGPGPEPRLGHLFDSLMPSAVDKLMSLKSLGEGVHTGGVWRLQR
jgi:hypothetical protein